MSSNDPDFTGTSSQLVEPAVLQARMPFRITVKMVDNYTNGKITDTYYDWDVTLLRVEVCRRDVWNNSLPRTRKAAITQARKAIAKYVQFQTTVATQG